MHSCSDRHPTDVVADTWRGDLAIAETSVCSFAVQDLRSKLAGMNVLLRGSVVVLLWVATTPPVAAGFRCGTDLVRVGDHVSRVLAKCGEPTYESSWTTEVLRERFPWSVHARHTVAHAVLVREFTYNLGRRRFMRRLRFEDDRLKEIVSLGYGY